MLTCVCARASVRVCLYSKEKTVLWTIKIGFRIDVVALDELQNTSLGWRCCCFCWRWCSRQRRQLLFSSLWTKCPTSSHTHSDTQIDQQILICSAFPVDNSQADNFQMVENYVRNQFDWINNKEKCRPCWIISMLICFHILLIVIRQKTQAHTAFIGN